MSALFSPIALRGLMLANRIVVAPMCQYSATDGRANEWHLMHWGMLAQSGAGLMCVEATAVTPEGRITPGCLGLWDDATEAAIATMTAPARRHSSVPMCIQLAHAGRKGSSAVPWKGGLQLSDAEGGWRTLAPSAVPHADGEAPPHALSQSEIEATVAAFAAAARRADRLGFDAIEIHGAHGYLIHEFLSPIANHRDDAYGGALANRMRFALQVFDAVREAFPVGKPVGMKISAVDWVDGGWDIAQSIALSRALKARGADWVTASSAGVSPKQQIALGPGYQIPFASAIRAEAGVATTAIGLITEPQQAEDLLAAGHADMVALARGMLYDPRWGWHAAAALRGEVEAAPQYWRAPPRSAGDIFPAAAHGAR